MGVGGRQMMKGGHGPTEWLQDLTFDHASLATICKVDPQAG